MIEALRRLFWITGARIFGKRRFGEAILSKQPTMLFLLVNAINLLFFRLGSSRSFLPSSIVVEPTILCNLKCPHCFRQTRGTKRDTVKMNLDFFKGFLDRNRCHITHIAFGMFGEPLMHPDIGGMIRLTSDYRIKSMIITNGSLIDGDLMSRLGDAGVGTICFSIDSIHEEYERHRHQPFAVPLAGLKIACDLKRAFNYRIEVCSLADTGKYSAQEIRSFFHRFSKEIDLVFFQPYYLDEANRAVPFSRPCYRPWHLLSVYADGIVTACCFDNDRSLVVGDARLDPLAKIFNDTKMRELRNAFQSNSIPDLCQRCHPHYR